MGPAPQTARRCHALICAALRARMLASKNFTSASRFVPSDEPVNAGTSIASSRCRFAGSIEAPRAPLAPLLRRGQAKRLACGRRSFGSRVVSASAGGAHANELDRLTFSDGNCVAFGRVGRRACLMNCQCRLSKKFTSGVRWGQCKFFQMIDLKCKCSTPPLPARNSL